MTPSSGNTDLPKSLPVAEDGSRRVLTLRSFGVGALISGLIAAIAPFNDSVVANSYLIGSYLPPALVLSCFVLIVLLNAPLHRLRPQWAFSAGELSVILAMLLVACAIPGQGLMRQLIPILVSSHHHGASDPQFWSYFASLGLPSWLFPERSFDPSATTSGIVSWFYRRVPEDQSIPFAAWVVPLAGWGIFFAAMFAVLLAMAEILRQQWAVNERLAFPLAQLQLALIEPPERGRGLNTLFRSRSFWLATVVVFIAHSLTVLHGYIVSIPALPLRWDLSGILSEPPWTYMHQLVKTGQIYFTFIGVTYFIQSRIALSLWAVFMIQQTVNMQLEVVGASVPPLAWKDQHLGAGAALLFGRPMDRPTPLDAGASTSHARGAPRRTNGIVRLPSHRGGNDRGRLGGDVRMAVGGRRGADDDRNHRCLYHRKPHHHRANRGRNRHALHACDGRYRSDLSLDASEHVQRA